MTGNIRGLFRQLLLIWGLMFCFLYFSGKVKILHPLFSSAPWSGVSSVLMALGRLLASQR